LWSFSGVYQGIENVNHSYNLAFAAQTKYPNVDLGYHRISQSKHQINLQLKLPYGKIELLFLNGLNINWDYAFNRFKNETNLH
jgi:hypothetical protein